MGNVNETAGQIIQDMNELPEGDPRLQGMADKYIETIAEGNQAEGSDKERPKR